MTDEDGILSITRLEITIIIHPATTIIILLGTTHTNRKIATTILTQHLRPIGSHLHQALVLLLAARRHLLVRMVDILLIPLLHHSMAMVNPLMIVGQEEMEMDTGAITPTTAIGVEEIQLIVQHARKVS